VARLAELSSSGHIERYDCFRHLMLMKITRKKLRLTVLLGALVGGLLLYFVPKTIYITWLRAHSTVVMMQSPPGGRHAIAVYRYPKLGHVPDYLGFGQGYVQLYDKETGRILEEKVTDDVAAIHFFAWGGRSVEIPGFVEWDVPGWYEAPRAAK
jgi:hypothetical protein